MSCRNSVTNVQTLSLNEAMYKCLNPDAYNFLYTDIDKEYWALMSHVLDSAVLQVNESTNAGSDTYFKYSY